jgi:hypothetical protein
VAGVRQPPRPAERALLALAALSCVMLPVRMLAAKLVGFGDSEALYACYALHPQPAYLDHPGLVGLFARLLGGGAAPTTLAAHTVTAIAATLAPWLVVLAARGAGGSWRAAARAGIGVAVVPEIAVGLFAMTPDLLLYVCWVSALGLAALGLRSAPSSGRAAVSLMLAGLLAGVGCAAKVSAGALVVGLAATYVARTARAHARTIWPSLGLGVGLLVIVPIVLYEARTGWPMLRHRLVDTQPGAGVSLRNAGALLLGQMVYVSPLAAVAAVIVARDLWRSRHEDVTSTLLSNATFVPLAVLLPLCLWSRVAEPHWIAPALLALPLHAARRMTQGVRLLSRRFATAYVGTAGAISAVAHLWVLLPGLVDLMPASYDARLDIANELYGWPQVVTSVRRVTAEERVPLSDPGSLVVVGPHWVVCAQLQARLAAEVPVGCAGPVPDDFSAWLPRARWEKADTLLYVSDNRFAEPDFDALFPDRVFKRETRVTVLRGGKVTRIFTIAVLQLRGAG